MKFEKATLNIQVQNAAEAESFQTSDRNLSFRELLKKKVKCSLKNWDKEGRAKENERTSDLGKLVQAIINREDWKPGNAVAFVISSSGKRVVKARQGNKEETPQLIVEAELPKKPRPEDLIESKHTVRLYFAEPQANAKLGDRVVHIDLAGERVANDFDKSVEASGQRKTVVREYRDVAFAKTLTIKLTPVTGSPVLSDVEIVQQPEDEKGECRRI